MWNIVAKPLTRHLIATIGNYPQLSQIVNNHTLGLPAVQFDGINQLVFLGVDNQNLLAVRPAVHKHILVVLHHLLRRGIAVQANTLYTDTTLILHGLRVEDINVRREEVCNIGFVFINLMYITGIDDVIGRRSRQTPLHLEGLLVQSPYNTRVLHGYKDLSVKDADTLSRITQGYTIHPTKDPVLYLLLGWAVIRKRTISCVEITFAQDKHTAISSRIYRYHRVRARIRAAILATFQTRACCHQHHGQQQHARFFKLNHSFHL